MERRLNEGGSFCLRRVLEMAGSVFEVVSQKARFVFGLHIFLPITVGSLEWINLFILPWKMYLRHVSNLARVGARFYFS